jgi:hypothetical protein
MATTTNYGWATPDDTDLVKDGAAAIRTLGSSADTTVKALSPGTTAGDLDYYTSGTAKSRLAIGTAGQVLTVNTGATAPEWAEAAGGGLTLLQTVSLSGSSTTSSTLSADFKNLVVYVKNTRGSVLEDLILRFNGDTGNNYSCNIIQITGSTVGASNVLAGTFINLGLLNDTADIIKQTHGRIKIWDYNQTDSVFVENVSTAKDNSAQRSYWVNGVYDNSAAISTITFLAGTATFTAGSTAYIYGEK